MSSIASGNDWTRALLCTLARRGTWIRHNDPSRASALLGRVAPWPWFKAGQFIFDLFEWEDFMVDGPPPPLFDGELDGIALRRLVRIVKQLAAQIDPTVVVPNEPVAPRGRDAHSGNADIELPAIEPGLHLYRDVVLGLLTSAGEPETPTQ